MNSSTALGYFQCCNFSNTLNIKRYATSYTSTLLFIQRLSSNSEVHCKESSYVFRFTNSSYCHLTAIRTSNHVTCTVNITVYQVIEVEVFGCSFISASTRENLKQSYQHGPIHSTSSAAIEEL